MKADREKEIMMGQFDSLRTGTSPAKSKRGGS